VRTETLEPEVERVLAADDYLSATYAAPDATATVEFFTAWYSDQTNGGIHSPEVCLPGGGWEMEQIERVDMAEAFGSNEPFMINRAIIQRGENRLLVYYWFEQYGGRTASDLVAKFALLKYGVLYNRTDGALVRMITPMLRGESMETAEARLQTFARPAVAALADFVPTRQ
jgi:EpsI family protein